MLSLKAIDWLKSVNYANKSHEERMTLIDAAKIAYPTDEHDLTEEEWFLSILGLT